MKSHEGFVDVESTPGQGTTIRILLPAMSGLRADELHDKKTDRKIVQGSAEKILLVDDDELVLDANQLILKQLGYSVHPFTSSREALRSFKEDPDGFDLIFSDLSMPEMDGLRLVSSIRRINPAVPAIICSGYVDNIDLEDLDNVCVLPKPSSAVQISAAIQQELKHILH